MYFRMAVEVICALFAVFGLYSAVSLLCQKLFGSKNIILAVEIKTEDDLKNAEMLIREALEKFLLLSSCRVAVLTVRDFYSDERLMGILRKYGAECYITDV